MMVYAVFHCEGDTIVGRRLWSMAAAESYVKHNKHSRQWIEYIPEEEYLASWVNKLQSKNAANTILEKEEFTP